MAPPPLRVLLLMGVCILSLLPLSARAQTVPPLINYQGRVVVGSTNFSGTGAFKFALVNAAGTTTYWSNDGTSTGGSEPTSAVSLTVNSGLYALALGDASLTNMTAIPASVFANNADVRLRVWFNDSVNGSQVLSPDERITSVGYAMLAGNVPAGAITSSQIANGAVTSTQIASGAVTGTQLASGLTLAGTTTGTFTGNVTGNVSGSAASFSGSLVGDVTGTQPATVVSKVGGSTAANVHTGELLANAATNANTASTLVKRDANGAFSAGTISATTFSLGSSINATTGVLTLGGVNFLHAYGPLGYFSGNTFLGASAGNFAMTGSDNTGVGLNALGANTTGADDAAFGYQALTSNTTGADDAAFGYQALTSNTTGTNNTAIGYSAMKANTTGFDNTAIGFQAFFNNTVATQNVAVGSGALYTQSYAVTSTENVAVGFQALYSNQPTASSNGYGNTALGSKAMFNNTTGTINTAIGIEALEFNSTGNYNVACGDFALTNNTTGSKNCGVGNLVLQNNRTGSENTALGDEAGTNADGLSNTTAVGSGASATASNMVRLGNANVTVIQGQVAYTFSSDRKLKENFRPVDGAEVLRKVRALDLTSWNYIGHDPKTFRHYGPMAQDFHAAFGHDAVGASGTDTTINSGDLAGITLIAVKELSAENVAAGAHAAEQDGAIKTLRDENTALKTLLAEQKAKDEELAARLARLERLIPTK